MKKGIKQAKTKKAPSLWRKKGVVVLRARKICAKHIMEFPIGKIHYTTAVMWLFSKNLFHIA